MEIKIEKSFLAVAGIVLAAVVGGIIWYRMPSQTATAVQPVRAVVNATSAQATQTDGLSVRENSDGDVTVSITPVIISESASTWKFDIAINTHTVDMSAFNPQTQIVLQDGTGNNVTPSNIATEGSGHHQTLKVSFPKVVSPWKLIVRDLAGIPAREFLW